MRKPYKRIYCCGDCIYYDWKKHACKRGAHEEGRATDNFFADCPEPTYYENRKKGGKT